MEEVLLYNLDNEKGNRIKQLCALMKIRFKSVSRVDYLANRSYCRNQGCREEEHPV